MTKKRPPAKQETAMQVRVPTDLAEKFKLAADNDNRSLSSWVRDRLEKAAKSELSK